jgi:hypothetical protein
MPHWVIAHRDLARRLGVLGLRAEALGLMRAMREVVWRAAIG